MIQLRSGNRKTFFSAAGFSSNLRNMRSATASSSVGFILLFNILFLTGIPGSTCSSYYDNIPVEDRVLLEQLSVPATTRGNVFFSPTPGAFQSDLLGCANPKVGYCPIELLLKAHQSEVPYKMIELPGFVLDIVKSALSVINDKTCLKFVEVDKGSKDMAVFTFVQDETNTKCWLNYEPADDNGMGRMIYLAENCFNQSKDVTKQLGEIHHFIMLGLGFPYEHVRADRDEHIYINKSNIPMEYLSSFATETKNETYMDAYDYSSVLHPYYNYLSVSPHKITVYPMKPASLGQRITFSDIDIIKIKRKFCNINDLVVKIVPSRVTDVDMHPVTETVTVTHTEMEKVIESVKCSTCTATSPEGVTTVPTVQTPTTENDIAIQPSKRFPCKSGQLSDFQTQTQITVSTVVNGDDTTVFTTTNKIKRTKILGGNLEEIVDSDTVYPDFEVGKDAFDISVVNSFTTILQTTYLDNIPNPLTTFHKKKSETKILNCA